GGRRPSTLLAKTTLGSEKGGEGEALLRDGARGLGGGVVAVAGGLLPLSAHRLAGLGGEPVDLLRGEHAALLEDFPLLGREGGGLHHPLAHEALGLARGELADLL